MPSRPRKFQSLGGCFSRGPLKRRSRSTVCSRRGFTLFEVLALSVVVAILVALLLPTFSTLREGAKVANCTSNLRQIAVGCSAFAAENGGKYPGIAAGKLPEGDCFLADNASTGPLKMVQEGYVTDKRIFYCPGAAKPLWFSNINNAWGEGPDEWHGTYVGYCFFAGYKAHDTELNSYFAERLSDNRSTMLAMDICNGQYIPGAEWNHSSRKPRGANILFNDGSVQWRDANDMIPRLSIAGRSYFW